MDPWQNLVDRSNAPVGRQMALILGEGVKKVQNTFVNIALIWLESVKSIGKFTRVFHFLSLSLSLCAHPCFYSIKNYREFDESWSRDRFTFRKKLRRGKRKKVRPGFPFLTKSYKLNTPIKKDPLSLLILTWYSNLNRWDLNFGD